MKVMQVLVMQNIMMTNEHKAITGAAMNKLAHVSLMLCAAIGISSCTTLDGNAVDRADRRAEKLAPRTPITVFNETLTRNALKSGNNQIKSVLVSCYGRGIGCTQGSLPVTNTMVYLYPYTPYLQETLQMEKKLKADIEKHSEYSAVQISLDPRLSHFRLQTKTDQYGRYSFDGLSLGRYYIVSEGVRWNNASVRHAHTWEGQQIKTSVNTPADLAFEKIIDIKPNSGVNQFESKMTISQLYVSQ